MTPVIMLYLCWLGQTPSTPTVDQVRQAMSAAVGSIKTAQVVYQVVYIEDKRLSPPTPEELRHLVSSQSIHPERDRVVNTRLRELNKVRHVRISVELDTQAGVWRVSTKDLRDLDAIMQREAFAPGVRGFLDQSGVTLADRDFRAWLSTGIGHLSTYESAEPFASPVVNSRLRIGAVPDEVFQRWSVTSIVACGSPSEQLYRVTLESPEGGKVVLEVDPKLGYRYRSYKGYGRDGNLWGLEEASDYRLVDGLYFPFKYEVTQYDASGTVDRHEKIVVQEAHFNQKLPPDALKLMLPPGTQISPTSPLLPPPRIEETQALDIGGLKALHGVPPASQPGTPKGIDGDQEEETRAPTVEHKR